MSDTKPDPIIELLKTKSTLKLDVFETTKLQFQEFKNQAEILVQRLKTESQLFDKRISIEYKEKGEFYFELTVASDILVFFMHSNIFEFDKNHYLWQSKYIKNDNQAIFCGQITVYNFLKDSIKFNRTNDIGYPIARIFVNKDKHYLAEGKGKMNQKHSHFNEQVLNPSVIAELINDLVLYCMNFDLFVSPFLELPEISVAEVNQITDFFTPRTGKRLGFKFNFEEEKP